MTAPDTTTVLDEHLEADLQPPCEVHAVHICPVHGSHHQRCEQPATWIARATCRCGHQDTSLVCNEHVAHLRSGIGHAICRGCGAVHTPGDVSIERL